MSNDSDTGGSLRCFLGMHTTKHPFIRWNPERLECRRCGKTLSYGRDYHPHRYDENGEKKRSLHTEKQQ